MKCKSKAFLILLLAAVFAAVVPLTVYAAAAIDYTKSGIVNITMLTPYQNRPISGLRFELYFVGAIDRASHTLAFLPAGDFESAGVSLQTMTASESKAAAKELADYADENEISGTVKITDTDGQAQFLPLELGLYLIVPDELGRGSPFVNPDPFLVSVPVIDNEGSAWEYDVNVYPKLEIKNTDPGETTTAPTTEKRETTTDGDIPKTNDSSPVMVLIGLSVTFAALLGLQLIVLKKNKKRENT